MDAQARDNQVRQADTDQSDREYVTSNRKGLIMKASDTLDRMTTGQLKVVAEQLELVEDLADDISAPRLQAMLTLSDTITAGQLLARLHTAAAELEHRESVIRHALQFKA